MKTALVHYWLVRMRGGERVLERMLQHTPDADVFTNIYDRDGVAELFRGRAEPMTTWVDKLPLSKKMYPMYLPLMPGALEMLDMSEYDLVISTEAGPAKWVIPRPDAYHVCYVHTPMRHIWDQRTIYRSRIPALTRPIFDLVTGHLRRSDILSSTRVDRFIANSSFVASRIQRYYRRRAAVIHPPVPTDDIPPPVQPDDYYLLAGQLVSYKKATEAVDACVALGRRLIVVGNGPDLDYVKQFADRGIVHHPNVPREKLISLMRHSKALLMPGVEDFGIIPVEVMASGRPVIGLGRGGILDTVVPRKTGILYQEPTSAGLAAAILEFEAWEPGFNPQDAVDQAATFSPESFDRKWSTVIRHPTFDDPDTI